MVCVGDTMRMEFTGTGGERSRGIEIFERLEGVRLSFGNEIRRIHGFGGKMLFASCQFQLWLEFRNIRDRVVRSHSEISTRPSHCTGIYPQCGRLLEFNVRCSYVLMWVVLSCDTTIALQHGVGISACGTAGSSIENLELCIVGLSLENFLCCENRCNLSLSLRQN